MRSRAWARTKQAPLDSCNWFEVTGTSRTGSTTSEMSPCLRTYAPFASKPRPMPWPHCAMACSAARVRWPKRSDGRRYGRSSEWPPDGDHRATTSRTTEGGACFPGRREGRPTAPACRHTASPAFRTALHAPQRPTPPCVLPADRPIRRYRRCLLVASALGLKERS